MVVLGLRSGRMGFPSQIADDPLLDLVLAAPEAFPHSEERRLLYVAMTRARHAVFLLAPENDPSSFLAEIEADLACGKPSDPSNQRPRWLFCLPMGKANPANHSVHFPHITFLTKNTEASRIHWGDGPNRSNLLVEWGRHVQPSLSRTENEILQYLS